MGKVYLKMKFSRLRAIQLINGMEIQKLVLIKRQRPEKINLNSMNFRFLNPFGNQLTVQGETEIKKITICNIIGQLVFSREIVGVNSYLIPTDTFVNGIYFVTAEDKLGNRKTVKVVKR